jgi:hypothetical protein
MQQFIKDNLLVIGLLVISILFVLVIIAIIGWDLNPSKSELKLVKQVIYTSK